MSTRVWLLVVLLEMLVLSALLGPDAAQEETHVLDAAARDNTHRSVDSQL